MSGFGTEVRDDEFLVYWYENESVEGRENGDRAGGDGEVRGDFSVHDVGLSEEKSGELSE